MERVVDAAPPVRSEGDTTVYSIVEERVVKQIVVVEEIHVNMIETHTQQQRVVSLLREEISVEHLAAPVSPPRD